MNNLKAYVGYHETYLENTNGIPRRNWVKEPGRSDFFVKKSATYPYRSTRPLSQNIRTACTLNLIQNGSNISGQSGMIRPPVMPARLYETGDKILAQ